MKIIFAGTPQAAVPTLEALIASTHEVVAVLTRPDAPVGRKRVLTPSPVAAVALENNVPVIYANKVDGDIQQQIDSYTPQVGVVVAYGALLPQATLDSLEHGWLNLHFSALPEWRGAAPVQWQILSGATTLGSSVFSLVKELDAGDVFNTQLHPSLADETSGDALSRLSELGATQVLNVVDSIENDRAVLTPQIGESSYARKLGLDDGHLDTAEPITQVYNRFRGVTPEPGAYVFLDDERLKIHSARQAPQVTTSPGLITSRDKKLYLGCVGGSLELLTVQPAGKQSMNAMDWFRGIHREEVTVS